MQKQIILITLKKTCLADYPGKPLKLLLAFSNSSATEKQQEQKNDHTFFDRFIPLCFTPSQKHESLMEIQL